MSKYYYHGCSIDTMFEIMKCQTIKTQRDLGYEDGLGFNGLDYISVCCKLPDSEYEIKHIDDAYNRYIKNGFCFIISNEVEAIKATYLDWEKLKLDYSGIFDFVNENNNCRFSDMIDEYQIKNSISFDYIMGIGIPLSKLLELEKSSIKDCCYDYNLFKKIIEMAKLFSFDIIDTNRLNFLDEYELEKEKGSKVRILMK